MNHEPKDVSEPSDQASDLHKLSDAELVQRIADLQATVYAHLEEVSRRLGEKKQPTPQDPSA